MPKRFLILFLLFLAVLSVRADHDLLDNALEIKPHDAFAALPLRLSLEILQEGSNTFQIYAAS